MRGKTLRLLEDNTEHPRDPRVGKKFLETLIIKEKIDKSEYSSDGTMKRV